jgi:hypothetical protein
MKQCNVFYAGVKMAHIPHNYVKEVTNCKIVFVVVQISSSKSDGVVRL